MEELVQRFQDGGPLMLAILLVGLLSVALVLWLVARSIRRIRVPAPLWLLGPALTGGVGLGGTIWGLIRVQELLVFGPPELESMFLAYHLASILEITAGPPLREDPSSGRCSALTLSREAVPSV